MFQVILEDCGVPLYIFKMMCKVNIDLTLSIFKIDLILVDTLKW